MTAVDVLIGSKRDVRDSEIEKSLGGRWSETNNNTRRRADTDKESIWERSLKQHEDWLEKTKNALMVVASLIATMAFQIGVNPPGGVWQDDNAKDKLGNPVKAGSSVYAHKDPKGYERFNLINTVAFIFSLSIILLLMSGFQLRRKLFLWILMLTTWIAISTIALCYMFAIAALTPDDDRRELVVYVVTFSLIGWVILMALLFIAHAIRLIIMLVRKLAKIVRGGAQT